MPKPLTISVVTPSLNQARFLGQTIASVHAQTRAVTEHIVIDGGSNDGTHAILETEAARGTLTWISEADRGMYDAINKGLARARGDVLAYLNSDDAWFPWAVRTAMAVFEARPDVDLVFGDGVKIMEDTGSQRLRLFEPFDRISLANYESIMQPAVFWRRSLVDRIGGFDDSLRYVADLDYWLRAAGAGAKIVHVDEVIAVERIHAARLSSAQADAMAAENREVRARHAGGAGGPEARARAVERDERWQRWLWLRFMLACAVRPFGRKWQHFIRSGGITLRAKKVLAGSLPNAHQHQRLWDAVRSTGAAELVGHHVPPPPARRRARGLIVRATLIRAAMPHVLSDRRALSAVRTD